MALSRPPEPLDPEHAVALISRLTRHRAHRDRTGLLYVEGVRNLLRCVDHGVTIDRLMLSRRLLTSTTSQTVTRRLRANGIPTTMLTPEQFRSVSTLPRASGVGAIVRMPWRQVPTPSRRSLWVAIESVRSPGNLGTLIRSAAAFAADGIIVTSPETDPFDPSVVRASVGALFTLQIVRASSAELRRWIDKHRVTSFGASPDATLRSDQATFPPRTLLVIGEERAGLSHEQRQLCQQLIRIPMAPNVDSLNLAVAASVLLHQAAGPSIE